MKPTDLLAVSSSAAALFAGEKKNNYKELVLCDVVVREGVRVQQLFFMIVFG